MATKRRTSTQPSRAKKVTVADVRALALALPETEERPSYGTPGFRVSDTLFARVLDEESIVIKVDFDQREVLVRSKPETFVVTPHYQDYPMVIVRLDAVDRPLLRALLKEAWGRCASPKVLKAASAPEPATKRARAAR